MEVSNAPVAKVINLSGEEIVQRKCLIEKEEENNYY